VVAEPKGSTPLTPKPAIGHDPEPVPSTSHPHYLHKIHLTITLAAEPEGSISKKSTSVIGHAPELIPCIAH